MKALVVYLSTIRALGLRLDVRPYLEIATNTPSALREQARKSARRAYWRAARAGLRRAWALTKWQQSVAGHHPPVLLKEDAGVDRAVQTGDYRCTD